MEIIKEQPPAVYTLKLRHADVYALYQDLVGLTAETPVAHAPVAHDLLDALRDALREEA